MSNALHPFFTLSAVSLALLPLSARAAEGSPVNLPAVEVSGSRTAEATVTEHTREYTIPAMTSATGMKLSGKETPQAVSALTRRRIDDQKLTTLTDALQQTPGITVQAIDRGRSAFYARGFEVENYQVDGLKVSFDNQWITGENIENLMVYDHVEVVRGANALTGGDGNPAARVNLIRKHADSKTRRTVLEAGYGRWNRYSASIDHTLPLNAEGSVRGRIVAGTEAGESFTDFEKSAQNVFYGVIDADLGGKTKLSAGAGYRRNKQDGYMWGGLPLAFSDGTQTAWPRSKTTSTRWSYWNSINTNYFLGLKHRFNDDWHINLQAERSRNSSESKLLYMDQAIDKASGLGYGLWAGAFQPLRKETNVQLTVNGRYSLLGRRHEAVFGGQLNRNTNEAVSYRPDGMSASESFYEWSGGIAQPAWNGSYKPYTSNAHDRGLFAATRFNIGERLGIIAGLRLANYTRERSYYGTRTRYRSGNLWLPYGGATFDFNDNHTLYASYTDSFKTQYQLDKNGAVLDPTRGKNYEIGLKSSFFDDTLHSQLSLFAIKQDNVAQQDGTETVAGMPAGTTAYYNAKGVRTRGYEIELNGRLTPRWNISAAFASARARAADDSRVNPEVPVRQFKLFTTYDLDKYLPGLTVGGGINWQSDRHYEGIAPLNGTIRTGSRALVDLMARYRAGKNLSVQLNADNVFDKKYYSQFSYNEVNYGMPRNIRASVRYEF